MIIQVALGLALMTAATFVHSIFTFFALWLLRQIHADRWHLTSGFAASAAIAGVVVTLFLVGLVEAAIWARTYVWVGALSSFEEALYFSIVTFTTLGFGDITLTPDWRLLGSIEAATGIILFGWSTALVFAFVQRILQVMHDRRSESRS